MPNARRAAELIQADLAKVGVTAEIVTYEWTEYLQAVGKEKDRDGAFHDRLDRRQRRSGQLLRHAARLRRPSACQQPCSSWCNKDFETCIKKAKTTSDQAERTKLYEQAQVDLQEGGALGDRSPTRRSIVPMSKKVTGFMQDPLGIHRFDGVDIAE